MIDGGDAGQVRLARAGAGGDGGLPCAQPRVPPGRHRRPGGREVASQSYTVTLAPSRNPVYLGTNKNGPTSHDEPLVGRLDEVVLYDRALPPAAIAALAAGATPRRR